LLVANTGLLWQIMGVSLSQIAPDGIFEGDRGMPT